MRFGLSGNAASNGRSDCRHKESEEGRVMEEVIWAAIHKIERATSKDDLSNMSRTDLENLVIEVYDELKKIEQI